MKFDYARYMRMRCGACNREHHGLVHFFVELQMLPLKHSPNTSTESGGTITQTFFCPTCNEEKTVRWRCERIPSPDDLREESDLWSAAIGWDQRRETTDRDT